MSNARLRQALQTAGLQPEEFAELMEVDVKTARRWLSGSTPTTRHRGRAIEILGPRADVTEAELWPEAGVPPAGDDSRDLIAIYARSDDIRIPDWRALLQTARTNVQLLDTTLVDIVTATGTTDLLIEKARAGTQIRILTAHPESIALTLLADPFGRADRDEHRHTQLDRDLALSYDYIGRLHDHPGIELLAHWAEPGAAILRFDDQMLVSLHLHDHQAGDRPLLHLRRRAPDGLFDTHQKHIDQVAADADPIGPAGLDSDRGTG